MRNPPDYLAVFGTVSALSKDTNLKEGPQRVMVGWLIAAVRWIIMVLGRLHTKKSFEKGTPRCVRGLFGTIRVSQSWSVDQTALS